VLATPGGTQVAKQRGRGSWLLRHETPFRRPPAVLEKRGMTATELVDALGLHDVDLLAMEKRGATVSPQMLHKISDRLGVFSDQLAPPEVAP
jgi:hypothetical protein